MPLREKDSGPPSIEYAAAIRTPCTQGSLKTPVRKMRSGRTHPTSGANGTFHSLGFVAITCHQQRPENPAGANPQPKKKKKPLVGEKRKNGLSVRARDALDAWHRQDRRDHPRRCGATMRAKLGGTRARPPQPYALVCCVELQTPPKRRWGLGPTRYHGR